MLEQAELVVALHEEYIAAGADIITINTYSCTPERLAQHADQSLFQPLQAAACKAAAQARENTKAAHVKVAGCLPPLVASYRPELAPDREVSLATYRQICNLQATSVDLFLCETMGSIAEALAATTAALETGKPVWVAMTLDDRQPHCLRSGEPLSDAVDALQTLPITGLLLNCSRPETIRAAWQGFTRRSTLPVGAYANGFTAIESLQPGGTVNTLEARHDLGPEAYARFAMDWVGHGATMVGGCCEVGPAHIAMLREQIDKR
jgi:S-methylmethionine-dependent homocysteine/selenocysteine methylase